MSYIAQFLNQPETVFAKKRNEGEWELRWYTPAGDAISPGGNGTLALGHVLLNHEETNLSKVKLSNQYPQLSSWAERQPDGQITVSLPAVAARSITPEFRYLLDRAFSGQSPHTYLMGIEDLIMVFDDEEQVRAIEPDFSLLVQTNYVAYVVTAGASGRKGGFVYRTFITSHGRRRWECPGSARALMNLVPYWHLLLGGKQDMVAQQLSERGGEAVCRLSEGQENVIVTARCLTRCGPATLSFESLGGEETSIECDCNPLIWY